MKIACEHCGTVRDMATGHVNRARKRGDRLFCSRACSGVARRSGKTKAQLVAEKREYDQKRRKGPLRELILQEKRDYHKRTYDPAKAADYRKGRMAKHVEYCRQPEYRMRKAEYDRRYRAQREFGDYGDAFLALQDIEREVAARMSRYEVYAANGLLNKRNNRRRNYENPLGL